VTSLKSKLKKFQHTNTQKSQFEFTAVVLCKATDASTVVQALNSASAKNVEKPVTIVQNGPIGAPENSEKIIFLSGVKAYVNQAHIFLRDASCCQLYKFHAGDWILSIVRYRKICAVETASGYFIREQITSLIHYIHAHKLHTCAYGGERGGFTPSLGSRKMLLVSDFWKINKKF